MNAASGLELTDVGFDGSAGVLLDGIDLRVGPGTLVVVSGPSGSGKSVLARVLAGLLEPSRGVARVDGIPFAKRENGGARPAYAPQEGDLVATLTSEETVGLPLQARGIEKTRVHERVLQWLDSFGLASLADRPVAELSGGQRQRVILARAFSLEARALVLDEPTAGLDADNRSLVCQLIFRARSERASVFCVSHDGELLDLADARYTLMPGDRGSRLVTS